MDLRFTEEQEKVRRMVREFARQEIAPVVQRMEETDRFPLEVIRNMGGHGLMGIPVPREYGGAGMDFVSYISAIEEISKVSAAVGVILSVHTSVGTNPILSFGTKEQKQKFIPPLASGRQLAAFALTEPGAGSDAGRIRTTAVKKGGRYILNGSKMFITNAGVADVYITFAVTDPGQGIKGITAFIVEKDTPGLTVGKKEKKMGLFGSYTAQLIFDHAELPVENRLGQEGEGFKIAMANLDAGRIGIAAQALGIAGAALDVSVEYAKGLIRLGQPPVDSQAMAFKLANMATQTEAARLLVYRAADLRNRGLPCGKEAAMAKWFAADTAMQAAIEAVQLFGNYGYCKDYPVEQLFRDAKVTQIYEGTNEIQRIVISKYLLAE